MAITPRQNELYTDLLFKKIAAGVSDSNPDTPYFEQPITGRTFVDLTQIWAQSDQIPNTAAPVIGVVEQLVSVQMTPISGFPLSYWFGTKKAIIPFNYGDQTSYVYILQTSTSDPIFLGINEWYVDPDTGVLTFLDGNPPGVSHASPPVITCWEYVGLTAQDTGLGGGGGGGTGSIGEWQDSVLGFSDSLSTAGTNGAMFEIYTNPDLLGDPITFPLTNGLRYIHIGFQVNNVPIYDPETDETTLGTVLGNDILTYWDAVANGTTNGGWLLFRPTPGTFSSVDTNHNSIIRFSGGAWINQYFEKTVPREMKLVPEASDASINDWQILSNTTISEMPSIIDTTVYVNNVKINDIEPGVGYKWGTTILTDVSSLITNGTNTTFDVIGGGGTNAGPFYIGQVLNVTAPGYGFVNVIAIENATVTVSNDVGAPITNVSSVAVTVFDDVLLAISDAGGVLSNVYVFWNSGNTGYGIELDDELTLEFFVIEN